MRRRTLTFISLLIGSIFLVYGTYRVSETKERILREYMRHKEFLYLIGGVERKRRADEASVRNLLEDFGVEPERISMTDLGVEVVVKELDWRLFPELIKRVEERFQIISLEAVDNTGRGRFRVRMVVR
ncbi:MAG: hypothetical protein Q9N26_05415 [Aquificota bacterium]|nr:hypothetical protein [Aquificota bacterium]